MTDEIRRDLRSCKAFLHVIHRCIDEEEFIEQFCRLYEIAMPRPPQNAIEAMVDEATGYRDAQYKTFFEAFIPFVHRTVYKPMVTEFEQQGKPKKGGF